MLNILEKAHIRFENIINYEAYIKAKFMQYPSICSVFTVDFYELDTPICYRINRLRHGKGFDFKHKVFEMKEIVVTCQRKDIVL